MVKIKKPTDVILLLHKELFESLHGTWPVGFKDIDDKTKDGKNYLMLVSAVPNPPIDLENAETFRRTLIYSAANGGDVVELSVQGNNDTLHVTGKDYRFKYETKVTSTPDRSGIATFEYMQTKEVVHSTYQGTMDKPKLVEASETVIVRHVSCSTKKLLPLVVE